MPLASRLMVRSALAWLLVGLLLRVGVGVVPPGGSGLGSWLAAAQPAALHALTVGWLTQVVFGVGWWLLPRPQGRAPAGRPEWAPFVACALLNAGVLLRMLAEPALARGGGALPRGGVVVSALLVVAAAACFAGEAWPRTAAKRTA